MKNSIKILLFISLILFVAISLTGCRGDGNATNENNFDFNSATGTIKGFDIKEISDLVIPSQIDGVDVREIGVRVFRSVNLASVEIPSGVEVIGVGAFRNNSLTSVKIPDSVKEIRKGAFADNDLKSVEIPDSVELLGFAAFSNNSLSSVVMPENLGKLEGHTFADNDLTSVKIPDSVKAIKYSAFVDNNLTSVELPAGVDLPPVRRKAFDGNLKEVYDENNKEEGVYVRDDVDSDWYKQE